MYFPVYFKPVYSYRIKYKKIKKQYICMCTFQPIKYLLKGM